MSTTKLFAEAADVAQQLGYRVSGDWLDGCCAGSSEAAGEKWILLDFGMSKQDQVRQILFTIHEEAKKMNSISKDLRHALAGMGPIHGRLSDRQGRTSQSS